MRFSSERDIITYLRCPHALRGRRSGRNDTQELRVDRTANRVLPVHRLVDNRSVTADLADNPVLCFHPSRNRLAAVISSRGGDFNGISRLDRAGSRLVLSRSINCRTEPPVDLCRDFTMTVIQIIAGTGFVRIIAVNGHIATVKVIHALVLCPYSIRAF